MKDLIGKTIEVEGQKLEVLEVAVINKCSEHATVYVIKKPRGKKLGKLFLRDGVSTYLFSGASVNFETELMVAA